MNIVRIFSRKNLGTRNVENLSGTATMITYQSYWGGYKDGSSVSEEFEGLIHSYFRD